MSPRARAARLAIALLSGTGALVLLVAPASAAPAQSEPSGSNVEIVQTPAANQGPCVPALLSLSNTVRNRPESFTLRIVASSPICPPVRAAAVVYAMPGNGEAWPQELVERVEFTLDQAGVTEVIFTKGCEPVQFDVITGASPQTISPTGEWHGPLLFPLDTGTALQYSGGGEGCTPESTTTTTTESTTTTSEPEILGTTTVPEVLGSTTVPGEQAVPVSVAGATQTPSSPASLALTGGSRSVTGTAAGLLLLLAGAALVVASRRRGEPAENS